MRVILASASPRRVELLKAMGVAFTVQPAEVLERDEHHLGPYELAMHNAQLKARAVAQHQADALVIGADTIVVLENEVLGKPADLDDARRMLRRLSGKRHSVITGVCLIEMKSPPAEKMFNVETFVQFHPLTEEQIENYICAINVLDKAGSYAIQEGPPVVASIEGSYTNVVGFPTERVSEELRARGMAVKALTN